MRGPTSTSPRVGSNSRKLQLTRYQLHKCCLERGILTAANVADHVCSSNGDWTKFVTGELEGLCEPCHKVAERQIELSGSCDIGLDGVPNHPFNRAR